MRDAASALAFRGADFLLFKTISEITPLCYFLAVVHADERQRPDVARRRRVWLETQAALAPARLLCIDETGVTAKTAWRYGRAKRGQRCHGAVPGRWKTTMLNTAFGLDGLRAPMVLEGAMNGAAFLACVEQVLAPEIGAGDRVVMDNLSSHHVWGVREAIEGAGGECLSWSPCSPDFNPIEQTFAEAQSLVASDSSTHRRGPVASRC